MSMKELSMDRICRKSYNERDLYTIRGKGMTLQQLKYLVTVAECGSISEAAQKLFISQPSLSAAIQNLEKEMGVTAFSRSSKGVVITREGEELLAYSRMLLEQADIMQEHFGKDKNRTPKFSVSCQHYSFAVNALVDVIQTFDADEYDFTLRETQTFEIIDDVNQRTSEIGILYLSKNNEDVITKMIKKYDLQFNELFTAKPHVFLNNHHPLSQQQSITLEDLEPYPYLSFEQGLYNSFYFSEEILSSLDRKKNIKVRDRATLFNLLIGLNGYTVSSGVISKELNGPSIIAKPLEVDEWMKIGTITQKHQSLSPYGKVYMDALKKHIPHSD